MSSALPHAADAADVTDVTASAPPPSRTSYVVDRLKRELADGTLRAGQALRQVHIAHRYGVSVTPVREALRILAADGTISYLPHRGATVRDIEPEAAADLYRLRASVEGLATRTAVERMRPERMEVIVEADRQLRVAKAGGAASAELSRLNKALHFAIYQSGSALMMETIVALWSRFPASVTIWGSAANADALESDHAGVLDAIRAGEAQRAGSLMSEHILHAAQLREG